jgi:translation initiation factor 4E
MSHNDRETPQRQSSFTKRYAGDTHPQGQRTNQTNTMSPLTATPIASPNSNASSAFALGSGAFASFGTLSKSSRSAGPALDFSSKISTPYAAVADNRDKDSVKASTASLISKGSTSSLATSSTSISAQHRIKYAWVIWYRPPTSKYSDYEKSTIPLAAITTVEDFWSVYSHLLRPSQLPAVSDYHVFRKGIRPVWEDEANKKGGKWIIRLKKGVADRFWEDLLIGLVGDQFAEAGEEICGVVLSVRAGEDVLSIWTRIDGGRNIKIR